MTSAERQKRWVLANPEKSRQHKLGWRMRQGRRPCLRCGAAIPYGSSGKQYCNECHPERLREHVRQNRAKRLRVLAEFKMNLGCSICGYSKNPAALQFHHLDPGTRERRVWRPTDKELEKCILVCANCHFELHHEKNDNGDAYR